VPIIIVFFFFPSDGPFPSQTHAHGQLHEDCLHRQHLPPDSWHRVPGSCFRVREEKREKVDGTFCPTTISVQTVDSWPSSVLSSPPAPQGKELYTQTADRSGRDTRFCLVPVLIITFFSPLFFLVLAKALPSSGFLLSFQIRSQSLLSL
jgi:hypothetical protein